MSALFSGWTGGGRLCWPAAGPEDGWSLLQALWEAQSVRCLSPRGGEGRGENGLGHSPFFAPDCDTRQLTLVSFLPETAGLFSGESAVLPDSVEDWREARMKKGPTPYFAPEFGQPGYW